MSRHPAPEELVLDYATGALPQAPALAVALHVALDPAARQTVDRLAAVGGALIEHEAEAALDGDALDRAMARGAAENRFEKFGLEFHERLRQAFLDIAKRSPERCRVIDASGSEEQVAEAIFAAVSRRFDL